MIPNKPLSYPPPKKKKKWTLFLIVNSYLSFIFQNKHKQTLSKMELESLHSCMSEHSHLTINDFLQENVASGHSDSDWRYPMVCP